MRAALALIVMVVCGVARGQDASDQTANVQPVRVEPLRLAVVGMVHGHVEGVLWNASQRKDIVIVGVWERDRAVFDRLAAKYKLDSGLYHSDLGAMLDACKPEAVSVMTSIRGHLEVAEVCGPRGVHMLMEKPLAFTASDAERMRDISRTHKVHVLTNYETSWYASLREAKRMIDEQGAGSVRKMIFRHGHKGPKEIGCAPEFAAWLTDPVENGGGAIVDFGCYGAALSTWAMKGAAPLSVTATSSRLKPLIYPLVDDDATIVMTYPGATAIAQASWAWTHDNKEADFHLEGTSIHAGKWNDLSVRRENQPARVVSPPSMPDGLQNEWVYLRRVVRGECEVDALSSIDLNVVVARILEQARMAASHSGVLDPRK